MAGRFRREKTFSVFLYMILNEPVTGIRKAYLDSVESFAQKLEALHREVIFNADSCFHILILM